MKTWLRALSGHNGLPFELLLATVARKTQLVSYLPVCETLSADSTLFASTKQQEEIKHPQVDCWREAAARRTGGRDGHSTTPIIQRH